jgi:hypothetical protein
MEFEKRRPKGGVGRKGWVDDKKSEFLSMLDLRPHPSKLP